MRNWFINFYLLPSNSSNQIEREIQKQAGAELWQAKFKLGLVELSS
jgi:hypothetical protein